MPPVNTPEDETIAYYDHNAERFHVRSSQRSDLRALETFRDLLPARGRILDAGCGTGRDLDFFSRAGFEAEGFDGSSRMIELSRVALGDRVKLWKSDFRFLNLSRDSYDGIWANRSLIHLAPVLCQRVIQTFFSALKPKGILFVCFFEGPEPSEELNRVDDENGPARTIFRYPALEFESMLRQSGFQPLMTGHAEDQADRVAIIARRI